MKPKKVAHNGQPKWKVERTVDGKRQRKYFSSKAKADLWVNKQMNIERRVGQEAAIVVNDDLVREVLSLTKLLKKYDLTLREAVEQTIERIEEEGTADSLGKIRDAYLKEKSGAGLRDLTIKELERRTGVFVQFFGPDTLASAVTADKANQWINSIPHSMQTRNHYRRVANGMMAYAVRFHGLAKNPFTQVAKKKVTRSLPGIFSIGQMRTMLDAASGDSELTVWIALGAYAGIRAAEIERMDWSDIHIKTSSITIRPEVAKSSKARTVTIRKKLLGILRPLEQLGGPIIRSDMSTSKKLKKFREGLNFPWPHNGLRHSFGTYHYRAFRHAGETAIQLGHRGSPTMLLEHYDRGDVTKDEALDWWGEPREVEEAEIQKVES